MTTATVNEAGTTSNEATNDSAAKPTGWFGVNFKGAGQNVKAKFDKSCGAVKSAAKNASAYSSRKAKRCARRTTVATKRASAATGAAVSTAASTTGHASQSSIDVVANALYDTFNGTSRMRLVKPAKVAEPKLTQKTVKFYFTSHLFFRVPFVLPAAVVHEIIRIKLAQVAKQKPVGAFIDELCEPLPAQLLSYSPSKAGSSLGDLATQVLPATGEEVQEAEYDFPPLMDLEQNGGIEMLSTTLNEHTSAAAVLLAKFESTAYSVAYDPAWKTLQDITGDAELMEVLKPGKQCSCVNSEGVKMVLTGTPVGTVVVAQLDISDAGSEVVVYAAPQAVKVAGLIRSADGTTLEAGEALRVLGGGDTANIGKKLACLTHKLSHKE